MRLTRNNGSGQAEALRRLQIGGVLAVLPMDAFTGKTILAKEFVVEIDGTRPPVRKRDGFFVFSHVLTARGKKEGTPPQKEGVVTVRLKGRGYQESVLHVPLAGISSENPVITVRMHPNASYPFPPHTICMEGRISENCILSAALLKKECSFRLAEDYHAGGEIIAVHQGERRNLTGGYFYLEAESDRVCGSFLLLNEVWSGRTGSYRLSAPLPDSYDKKTTRLYPARMQEAGNRAASYFFAFDGKGAVPGAKGAKAGCDILCRTETPERVEEYRFFVGDGGTRVMDF